MRRKELNSDNFLYSKTKEHPAIRFSKYWGVDKQAVYYLYEDVFDIGLSFSRSLQRFGYWTNKMPTRSSFQCFIKAGKKYIIWQRSKATQRTQRISQELRNYVNKRNTKDTNFGI